MAKGPIITNAVEAIIAAVYQKHPKWKAPEVRNEVSHLLRKDNPQIPSGWPSLSSVQKVLATVRRTAKDDIPQKKPWSMATLDEHPIPPEAIPFVLNVWKLRVAREEGFTIREAKWVARLFRFSAEGIKDIVFIKWLSDVASTYAQLELLYLLIKEPLDTTLLDANFMDIPRAVISDDFFKHYLVYLAQQKHAFDQIKEDKGIIVGKLFPTKIDEGARIKWLAMTETAWEKYKEEVLNERPHNQKGEE
jgi:hypothetical protein